MTDNAGHPSDAPAKGIDSGSPVEMDGGPPLKDRPLVLQKYDGTFDVSRVPAGTQYIAIVKESDIDACASEALEHHLRGLLLNGDKEPISEPPPVDPPLEPDPGIVDLIERARVVGLEIEAHAEMMTAQVKEMARHGFRPKEFQDVPGVMIYETARD